MCVTDRCSSSGERRSINRGTKPSIVVADSYDVEEKVAVWSPRARPSSNIDGSMIFHVLYPYRRSIFLFLLSYTFALIVVHDQIQKERRLDSLRGNIHGGLDINTYVNNERKKATAHDELMKMVEKIENVHHPYDHPFVETPFFETDIETMEAEISRVLPGLRSCRWNGTNYGDPIQCGEEGAMVYYNRFDQARFICGQRVEPQSYIQVKEHCKLPSSLFSHEELSISLRTSDDTYKLLTPHPIECDTPCSVAGDPSQEEGSWSVDGTNWMILQAPYLHIRPHAHLNDVFYSTTSFQSDIPIPKYTPSTGTPANFSTGRRDAFYWEDECQTPNQREKVVSQLQETFPVESMGKCNHNTEPPTADKESIMKNYLFTLAFEDRVENDYVTEKVWQAFAAGSIPVYLGANNTSELVPPNSIIRVDSFNTISDLVEYLNRVATNRTLFDTYHAWRSQLLPQSFTRRYEFTETKPLCRMCRWAKARTLGLGWNSQEQTIENIERTSCIDGGGMVTTPLQESWYHGRDRQQAFLRDGVDIPSSCQLSNVVARIGRTNTERTVHAQDGILDMSLSEQVDTSLRWRFHLPMDNATTTLNNVFGGLAWAQDETMRVSFLTWPRQKVELAHPGIVEVPVVPNLKLRIIVEHVDQFHEGGNEYENYFGRRMREDLWNPIEIFAKRLTSPDARDTALN